MKNIFVGSDSQFCGKTITSICVAMYFMKKKKKVGYFKPCGTAAVQLEDGTIADYDALSAARHLKLKDAIRDISPVLLTHDFKMKTLKGKTDGIKKDIERAYANVSKGKDIVVVEGGRTMEEGRTVGYPGTQLIEDLDCGVIYVERYEADRGLDTAIAWRERLGDRFKGLIFNRIDPDHEEFITKHINPFLKKMGIPVLGIMLDDPTISAVTPEELSEALGGEIVSGAVNRRMLIRNFVIGAMAFDAAAARFSKVNEKAVITGGDRTDLQVAALDTNTRCLILTGGISPHPMILAKSDITRTPVIVVPDDTLAVMEKIDELVKRPHLKQGVKITRAVKMFNKKVDMKLLKL